MLIADLVGSALLLFLPRACPMEVVVDTCFDTGLPEITFFTSSRPPITTSAIETVVLAFGSWLSQCPRSTIVVFADAKDYDPSGVLALRLEGVFGSGRIRYAGPLREDHGGRPYIHDWLQRMRSQAGFVCMINVDIVLAVDWLRRVDEVCGSLSVRRPGGVFVGMGRRRNIWRRSVNYTIGAGRNEWSAELTRLIFQHPYSVDTVGSCDWYVFQAGRALDFGLIPPFLVGRYNWDSWMIGWLGNHAEAITLTDVARSFHVQHTHYAKAGAAVRLNAALRDANGCYYGRQNFLEWNGAFDDVGHAVAVRQRWWWRLLRGP